MCKTQSCYWNLSALFVPVLSLFIPDTQSEILFKREESKHLETSLVAIVKISVSWNTVEKKEP